MRTLRKPITSPQVKSPIYAFENDGRWHEIGMEEECVYNGDIIQYGYLWECQSGSSGPSCTIGQTGCSASEDVSDIQVQ